MQCWELISQDLSKVLKSFFFLAFKAGVHLACKDLLSNKLNILKMMF